MENPFFSVKRKDSFYTSGALSLENIGQNETVMHLKYPAFSSESKTSISKQSYENANAVKPTGDESLKPFQ